MILKLVKSRRHPLYCSFCGKDQDEVLKLVSGPNVHICDECVTAAQEIILEEKLSRGVSAVIGRKRG